MPKSVGYVSPQYLKMIADIVRSFKQKTYTHMDIRPGHTVLDLGCGPGGDTVHLAGLVGGGGKVYGLDMDEEMIALADKEAALAGMGENVVHSLGTVQALPFEDELFDSCRAERLFQVIPVEIDRNQIFREITRVLKPGGKLVLVDTDWATSSVDYSDIKLERTLMNFFAIRLRPDGFAGRAFKSQLIDHGFSLTTCESIAFCQENLEQSPFGDWLVETAREQNVITQAQGKQWLEELNARSKAGTYFSSVNTVLISGTRG